MQRLLLLLTISLLLVISSCNRRDSETLTIATAANMQFAITELVHTFTQTTGIKCEKIISSSGKITAQILEGAPYDIFLSADMKYPQKLFENGLTTNAPEEYAFGRLVLWSTASGIEPSIEVLKEMRINHIAIANPKIAPYGIAAVQALQNSGVYEAVKSKLVFGESIAQTNQFIASQAAEIGFTAKTVVLSTSAGGKWIEINSELFSPIAQGVVIIKNDRDKLEPSEMFYDFLFSTEGKEILNKFGYSVK